MKKILIVDDESVSRIILTKLFKALHSEITSVETGTEAIKLLKINKSFDIITIDMMLPDMNGAELAHKIREISPEIGIVVISGLSYNKNIQEILDLGNAQFIKKPYHASDLKKILDL